ncbi:MAG: lipid IV(A) 3-deoxy-D-manno-octulosonic acid transferase [Gammaproteobacteria bacterium]|nr:lipid IV(A) 3-deoxy-D-manno-octulosonic acid transferase [Gammaproteobacteria bacterium]
MRTLYTLLFYIALPFILIRLWWRGRHSPGYRQRVLERLGYYSTEKIGPNTLWLHAVSYGEAVAAEPLIVALLKQYPDRPLLVTTMTATGAARVEQRFAGQVVHQHVPYDYPGAVKRFFEHNQPSIAIIMETELWPNLIKSCVRYHVPVIVANARLSEKSFRGYRKMLMITRSMMKRINVIAAQSQSDGQRFEKLGATPEQVKVVGNLKFDMVPRPDLWEAGLEWRGELGNRPVWIAASTHPGEEEQVLEAHRIILAQHPNALLLLVPRHPERFDRVAELCKASNFSTERLTENNFPSSTTQIFLVDAMGMLPKFYRAADVAYVGGSLVPIGGHNIIEAASAKSAILFGPHMHNFTAIAEQFYQAKACEKVEDSKSLAQKVLKLLENPAHRQALIQAADQIVIENTGALEKTVREISLLLTQQHPAHVANPAHEIT